MQFLKCIHVNLSPINRNVWMSNIQILKKKLFHYKNFKGEMFNGKDVECSDVKCIYVECRLCVKGQ